MFCEPVARLQRLTPKMTDWGVPSTYRTRTDCCICSRQFLSARFDRIAACAVMSGFYDPSLEESGFEPLVPLRKGTGPPSR